MKKYRVLLTDNRTFVVTADRFDVERVNGTVAFYKSKEERDVDIYVEFKSVVAIVPVSETENESQGSWGQKSY